MITLILIAQVVLGICCVSADNQMHFEGPLSCAYITIHDLQDQFVSFLGSKVETPKGK